VARRGANPEFAFLDEDIEVKGPELKMAESLIDACSGSSTRRSTPTPIARRSSRSSSRVEAQSVVEAPGEAPTAGSVSI